MGQATRQNQHLERAVAVVLAAGILPSLTALSREWVHAAPALAAVTGPLNILKLALPLVCLYLWRSRARIPKQSLQLTGSALLIGTIAAATATLHCSLPRMTGSAREWAVILAGYAMALAWTLLDPKRRLAVISIWGVALYGTAALDVVAPSSITWLYDNVFDPNTRVLDYSEIGRWVLTGVFGRQSMAKLLAWLPWLLLAAFCRYSTKKGQPVERSPATLAILLLAAVSTGATLATSQRGPFIGAMASWVAFAMHGAFRLKNRKIAAIATGGLVLASVATVALVPPQILASRLNTLIGSVSPQSGDALTDSAQETKGFRVRMALFSLSQIVRQPAGNACIDSVLFDRAGVFPAHAHHLWIQQYRERGWVWGSIHILLWALAMVTAWRSRTWEGAALFAGISATVVLGQFDHAWFVLNHSIILWIYLLGALGLRDSYIKEDPR